VKPLSEITRDALELPPKERLALVRILIDISEEATSYDPEIDTIWEDEISRRIKSIEEGSARSRSPTDVFADLDSRFPG